MKSKMDRSGALEVSGGSDGGRAGDAAARMAEMVEASVEDPVAGRGRAIVLFGRSWHSLAAVRSLAARGVEVWSADEVSLTPAALSGASSGSFTYPDPLRETEAFLDRLEEMVDSLDPGPGVPYVLVPVQQETYVISAHRHRFEDRIQLALPPAERLDSVRHKGWLAKKASELGLNVPQTTTLHTQDDLERAIEQTEASGEDGVRFPMIFKPPMGAGGAGVRVVANADELREAWQARGAGSDSAAEEEPHSADAESGSSSDAPLLQEMVEGDEYCVTALCQQGRLQAVLTYRNMAKASSSAPGVVRETVRAERLESATRSLLEGVEWHGVAQVDFMWDGENEPHLIEVNPRLFGGLFQTVASGVDLPWMLFCLASGQPLPEPAEPEFGLRTETPVASLVGVLRNWLQHEEEQDDDPAWWPELDEAWDRMREGASDDPPLDRIWNVVKAAASDITSLPPLRRLDRLREILDENEDNVSQLMWRQDPSAAAGLMYPLLLLLRHGRLDADVLHGTRTDGGSSEDS